MPDCSQARFQISDGPESGIWLLVSGFWYLASGIWLLVSGFWLLVSGFWLLVSGIWLLVSGIWKLRFYHSDQVAVVIDYRQWTWAEVLSFERCQPEWIALVQPRYRFNRCSDGAPRVSVEKRLDTDYAE